ncbi:MAG: response regulator transcription factor [Steroidobacteraceae bacterium]|jgi:two-component system copper resistance phosphate regulon response regulator CusR
MRLLIVEDDRKLAEFVARGLRAEHCAVDIAADGREGLEYLQACSYDLLILDLMLPHVSGTELLYRVRRAQPLLPILVVTARDATEDKVRHFEAGADDYLTKPFDLAELIVRVKALLRRGPLERSELIRYEDLELNRLTRQVSRAGRSIELTGKEYALLEYLLSSPSRVFSRTMILEHVWDLSFEGVTNIVDVYVRHLRRKVDDPFPNKLIQTVRGVGYCVRGSQQPDCESV